MIDSPNLNESLDISDYVNILHEVMTRSELAPMTDGRYAAFVTHDLYKRSILDPAKVSRNIQALPNRAHKFAKWIGVVNGHTHVWVCDK